MLRFRFLYLFLALVLTSATFPANSRGSCDKSSLMTEWTFLFGEETRRLMERLRDYHGDVRHVSRVHACVMVQAAYATDRNLGTSEVLCSLRQSNMRRQGI